MNHCVTLLVVLACLGTQSELLAQSEWQIEGGRMRGAVVTSDAAAATRTTTLLEAGKQATIGAGEAQVHFPSNRAGKPLSLQFAADAKARVIVGIGAEPDVATQQAKYPVSPCMRAWRPGLMSARNWNVYAVTSVGRRFRKSGFR